MRNHLIAIQGSVSSFHDLAAKKYFGKETTIKECGSFKEVCDNVAKNNVDYGIIAIENKVAGSILLNYQLIEKYDLNIVGETFLPIELKLMSTKGNSIKNIKEIISHPMALAQSQMFLAAHSDKAVSEFKDTATCAKLVADDKSGKLAVIGGPTLAAQYNLDVIVENVCDVKNNYTRFYILSKGKDYVENPNKASVTMHIKNKPGSLHAVLEIIKNHQINLSKIQSLPIPNESNVYPFHFDFEFDDKSTFDKCLTELHHVTESIKVLGVYKGEKPLVKSDIEINLFNNLN